MLIKGEDIFNIKNDNLLILDNETTANYNSQFANENIYGVPLLNDTLIKCARILTPPPSEQKAIADFLDKKCGDIDKAITAFNTQIQQLTDYRKSLIFECITGKKQIFNR